MAFSNRKVKFNSSNRKVKFNSSNRKPNFGINYNFKLWHFPTENLNSYSYCALVYLPNNLVIAINTIPKNSSTQSQQNNNTPIIINILRMSIY